MSDKTAEQIVAEAMVDAGAPLMHSRVEEAVVAALRAHDLLVTEANQYFLNNADSGLQGPDLAHRLATALAAAEARVAALEALLPGDEDRESDAKVMPVSFEASAACSHGTCPNGCSHLMWQCSACSSEGGWGAPREKLETWAADHSCSTLPASSGETNRDGLAQVALAHIPVLGITGRVVGCRCMDRVFVQYQETWEEHLADAILAAGFSRGRDAEPEEWAESSTEYALSFPAGFMCISEDPADAGEMRQFVRSSVVMQRAVRRGPWLPVEEVPDALQD